MTADFIKDRLPYRLRRSLALSRIATASVRAGHKGYRDFIKSAFSASQRLDRSFGRPVHLTIEPTNICNLRCPVCETGNFTLGRRSRHMDLDSFKHIIDSMHDHLNVLYFYFMGEPFLARNAYDMIEYATRREIWVDTCTNGEFINSANLIDSGIGQISFQIGGMTQKTHETYRVNGDLDKSLTNLVSCVEEKRRRPDSRTRIKVGFIVMKHNEHEVEEFVRFAEETGVDGYEVLHPCVRNEEQGEEFLTLDEKYWIYDKEAFSKGILRPRFGTSHYCEWLYFATTVQVNGDVVPCCRDPRGQYILGNVLEQDFVNDIWNGERYREFRHTVAHNQKDSTICNLCAGYTAPDVTRHDAPEIPLRIEVPEPDRVAV